MSRVVVKVGGAVAADSAGAVLEFARENEVCVVHGAGPQISLAMERAGLPVEFIDGRRVTSVAGLDIVMRSLEEVSRALCAAIGERAVPFFGFEIGLEAKPMPELGLVGAVTRGRLPAIERVLGMGKIAVLAPVALAAGVGPLNVNADDVAAIVAIDNHADKLVFLTDVEGFILGGEVVDSLDLATAQQLMTGGTLDGRILPKLGAAIEAARCGIPAFIGRTEVVPDLVVSAR